VAKKIVYGTHAEEKFEILGRHGFFGIQKAGQGAVAKAGQD